MGVRPPSLLLTHGSLLVLLLVVALLLNPPGVQALSPSRMIASFAAQQRRAQGYHHGGSTTVSGRMAAASRHGPIPPKPPQPHMGGARGRGLPSKGKPSAFIASGHGDGAGEFAAAWNSGGAGAQVWQPPRGLLDGFKVGGPGEVAGSMGVSGLSGMAAGYVAKRFGRMLSFACGFVLVSMKVAEELGYIAVNWARIEDDTRALGQSIWGKHGKVRRKAERFAQSWQKELGPNAGIAGSFAFGFLYGLRAA
jgi:uncharacterized membrane protein (Fun14 family)